MTEGPTNPTEGNTAIAGDAATVALMTSAARWMRAAMVAWSEDDYGTVGALAPLAVEHLGKAVLWNQNPVLLVPLAGNAEPALFDLATRPRLESPKLRTVGLAEVLHRLERLLEVLPVDARRRKRLVEVRNGALHVGSVATSRHVLLDALALCDHLLRHLEQPAAAFYGEHAESAEVLLDEKRSEVAHRVAAKRSRARRQLRDLEVSLGAELFASTTGQLEAQAAFLLDPDDFGVNLVAVEASCPECGSKARLFGEIEVSADVDFDYEPLGGGEFEPVAYGYWTIALSPTAFSCYVCKLSLHGSAELAECGLPASRHEITPSELGADFDPEEFVANDYDAHEW